MRRLIALTATAAVALSLAPFGVARAEESQAQQVPPPTVSVTATGTTGVVTVHANVDIPDGNADSIKEIRAELVPASGSGSYGTFCLDAYPAPSAENGFTSTRHVALNFKWDSTRLPGNTGSGACDDGSNPTLPSGGDLSTNNQYRVKVLMWTYGVPTPDNAYNGINAQSGVVKVSNAPAKPTGVKLSYNEGSDTITVQWSATTTEPTGDIAYRVQECKVDKSSKPCGSWKNVADNYTDTKLSIKGDGPGIYRYRVLALRPDADGATLVSDPTSAQGDPTEIEIKEKPATPETTVPQVAGETTETTQPAPRTVVRERPTRRVQRGAPQVVQRIVEEEPGYNTELPYGDEEAISGLPIDDSGGGEGERAILIPLAGGLVLLMFALQVTYLNRRASSALEPVAVTGDGSTVEFDEGDDWDWDE